MFVKKSEKKSGAAAFSLKINAGFSKKDWMHGHGLLGDESLESELPPDRASHFSDQKLRAFVEANPETTNCSRALKIGNFYQTAHWQLIAMGRKKSCNNKYLIIPSNRSG